MKEIWIVRTTNDKNGNPRYLIDLTHFPDCYKLGKQKRNQPNVRVVTSYDIEKDISDCYGEKVKVNILHI